MSSDNPSTPFPALPAPVPQIAEASATFRTVPKDAEGFGTVPPVAERKENHTLTVRETARMFESAGVARTERSIINWCQPNRQGITRLDSYYDPNERKYYITPQSVEAVVQEEIQRSKRPVEPEVSESFGSAVAHVKHPPTTVLAKATDERKFEEMEREIMDLKIANRGKDYLIDQLKGERTGFFDQLLSANKTVGQLETKLRLLDGPKL